MIIYIYKQAYDKYERLIGIQPAKRVVYGGFSQTPWVQVPQLPVFRFSPFSLSRLDSN